MKLEFRLLGDFAVVADGQPLDLGGTRQRSLLALLVLNRNRPVTTEMLAERLWPDDQPLTAVKTIQVYVSRIRHVLGPDAHRLTSSATGYRLSVADDELDGARFERGLRLAREALAAGSSETSVASLEEIIALWSGPALGDLAGEQFARREADRLEELRLQAQWRRHFDAAKAIIDDIGLLDPFEIFMYPAFLGTAEIDNGEPGRVVELLQESCLTLDRLHPSTVGLATMAPITAQALLAAGRLDEVEHYAFWGRDLAVPDDIDGQVRWRLAVSGLRSAQGRHDEGVDLARAAVACTVGSEFVVLRQQSHFRLAAALRSSGDLAGALDAASEARRFAAEKQDQAALRKIEAFLKAAG